jgi:hypothetical protein
MYSVTSHESNSTTTDAANNVVSRTTRGAAVGSSRQKTSRSLNVTPIHSSCSSSTAEGIVKLLNSCVEFEVLVVVYCLCDFSSNSQLCHYALAVVTLIK